MDIAICGFGRAGKALSKKIMTEGGHNLVAVLCRKNSKNLQMDVGKELLNQENGVHILSVDEVASSNEIHIDVLIDFSHRDMATPLIELCGSRKCNIVICTTNHSVQEINSFQVAAEKYKIGIVYAPNLTIGINLLMDFVGKVSRVVPEWNFEIIEKHPRDKGRPTATARMISDVIDKKNNIDIHSVRMNGYVGVHEVITSDGTERLTVSHESLSREAFANGALLAANYITGKKGVHFMKDVINEIENNAIKKDVN